MPYFLAVDAGGTKTEFVLADEHRELARIRTGSIKRLREGEETTALNLGTALDALEAQSGISMHTVDRCCIGTSGETVPLVVDWLRSSFSNRVGGQLLILGDVEIALDAFFKGRRGVLVLSGTGSNVAGRANDGAIFTAGGWGPAMADQGAGHYIGVEALRRGFLAIDQQRPTRLLDAAREFWQLPSLGALIEFANANPAPKFSDFTPLVAAAADAGDAVALEVLAQGGADLASLAALVIERIRIREADPALTLPRIALAGSVLIQIAHVRTAFTSALEARFPGIEILSASAEPVSGALWRARTL